jgi:MFS family permease
VHYAPQGFKFIGLSGKSIDLLAIGVVGVINVFSTLPAIAFLDRRGHRKVLTIAAIPMGVSQLIVGTLHAVY